MVDVTSEVPKARPGRAESRDGRSDFKAKAAHTSDMLLHQRLAFLVCNRWVVFQKAIVASRFCFWASTTPMGRSTASETIGRT